jgi:G3E family GTPase
VGTPRCICCTLRADLLREVRRLAQLKAFDYCVIESTGISEPMQVAETFEVTLDELELQLNLDKPDADEPRGKRAKTSDPSDDAEPNPADLERQMLENARSLKKLARLDTCVTVVDAASFFDTFKDGRALSEQFEEEIDPSDERNVVDLMIDQIEFANVIIVNKIDLVSKATLDKVLAVVKKLNPGAELIQATRSVVPLDRVLNTRLFDMEKVQQQAGWLQSLREPIQPETLEYGVGSAVYRRRMPFHPTRFHELINKFWCVEEVGVEVDDDADENGEGDGEDDGHEEGGDDEDQEEQANAEGQSEENADGGDDDDDNDDDDDGTEERAALEAYKSNLEKLRKEILDAKEASPFKGILRSKGFVWIGSKQKNKALGFWSSSGIIASLGPEGKWFCEVDPDEWPAGDHTKIRQDIGQYPHGDRRIEIVFIGINVDFEAAFAELDKALCTEEEVANMPDGSDDPFVPWDLDALAAAQEAEHEHEHEHHHDD